MSCLCIILARAGSKGLPHKNILETAGRPMIAWTISHALAAKTRGTIDHVVVSTDGDEIATFARRLDVEVIMRPDELADDTATVDAAARHAVERFESQTSKIENVVLLYGNVPVRPDDLIDNAVAKLRETGCDSVQSVCAVGKHHPYWMKRLDGDRLLPYVDNAVYRRQDLPPVYQLDGGIIAVTRAALFTEREGEPHAFLGKDRRAVVTKPGSVVDVDTELDRQRAESTMLGHGSTLFEQLNIRDRLIGDAAPVYVIAEIGVNHDGVLERALELTAIAEDCGADAVKLQLFDPDLLLSAEAELATYQQDVATDPRRMLRSLQLTVDEMLEVKQLAHTMMLDFIVTPFSIENLDDMRRLDPDAVKIASPDCMNTPLIEAMASLGKPMIVSLGTANAVEIAELDAMVSSLAGGSGLALLQCVSAYPVPAGEASLVRIRSIADRWRVPCGYSDHTTDERMGMLAVGAGACLIEKHLTYNTRAEGPDHAASFDAPAMRRYIDHIRFAEREMVGEDEDDIEADVRRVSRQSVCAVRDLPAGHVVAREDVTVKRPGTGIPAARLNDVVGKALLRAVRANHLVHDGDVEL